MDTRKLVEERLVSAPPCRHCNEQTTLKFIPADEMLVACYSCPTGYISRMINYGAAIDLPRFKQFLSRTAGKLQEVKDADIRVATHYAWDVGVPSSNEKEVVIRGAFWNQNYRRTQNPDPSRDALFLCSNCKSTFVQPLTGKQTLCENCRGNTSS